MENNKILVDCYFEYFSNIHQKAKNDLKKNAPQILEGVKNFYGSIGQEYGLKGVDIDFKIHDNPMENHKELNKNHLALIFTDKDFIFQKYSIEDIVKGLYPEDYDKAIKSIYGAIDEEAEKLNSIYSKFSVNSAKPSSEKINLAARNLYTNRFKLKFYKCIITAEGMALRGLNTIHIYYPVDYIPTPFNIFNNFQGSNSECLHTCKHELGHMLGLEHVNSNTNLMRVAGNFFKDTMYYVQKMSVKKNELTYDQVLTITNHFS